MDFIQKIIGVMTERTIYYRRTTPHYQMVQPTTNSMDTWVKHVTYM